jgi:putrescine transport system permease protein
LIVSDGRLQLAASLANYRALAGDALYLKALLGSLRIAGFATAIALLIGYPLAYAIVRSAPHRRLALLLVTVAPFWMSFLIRTYAWIGLLRPGGTVNAVLSALHLIDAPLRLLNTSGAAVLGIVYLYLPFMVLALFARLERQDPALLEAAADLGANPARAFLAVTLPLSLPGVAAGCLLVFIPALGEFVVPELLGGPNTLMIGKVLWNEFFSNRDWPMSSAITIALLVILLGPMLWFQALLRRMEAPQ